MPNVTEAELRAMLARRRPRKPAPKHAVALRVDSSATCAGVVYALVLPGKAPSKNLGRNPGTKGHRARGTGRWREDVRAASTAQLREQGLWAPLEGAVWLVVEEHRANGRLDAGAGLAEAMDALQGALYLDDRQVRRVASSAHDRAERAEVLVWAATSAEEWLRTLAARTGLDRCVG